MVMDCLSFYREACRCARRKVSTDDAEQLSHRVPREHFRRPLERREGVGEGRLELLGELLRGPAVRAMQGADRPGLVEQMDLVVARRENLPGDAFGAVGGEIDDKRRDLF